MDFRSKKYVGGQFVEITGHDTGCEGDRRNTRARVWSLLFRRTRTSKCTYHTDRATGDVNYRNPTGDYTGSPDTYAKREDEEATDKR